jgi:hypothetical protein
LAKTNQLRPVVADGFNRATFLGFLAACLFIGRGRLFIDKGISAVLIAFEIIGRGFAAQVAVNALVVHVVFSRHVFGVFVCYISHKKINLNLDYGIYGADGKPDLKATRIKDFFTGAIGVMVFPCDKDIRDGRKSFPHSVPPLIPLK